MKHLFGGALLGASMALSSVSAVQAGTVDVVFSFEGLAGNIVPNLYFVDASGLTLSVTPHTFEDTALGENAVLTASSPDVAIGINNKGIGVCEPNRQGTNCTGSDMLDGGSAAGLDNELLLFTFDRLVSSISVIWSNNDQNDVISLMEGGTLSLTNLFNAIAPPDRTQGVPISGPLSIFGLGVQDDSDEVRVAGLLVSYAVPLPAAGWLMVAGIGGIAALRRRKRA